MTLKIEFSKVTVTYSMTPNRIKDSLNYQTCLCCMCRCGDHKCFQQLASELPSSMQQELVYDDTNVRAEVGQKKRTRQADLYRKTIYRQDYCEQPDMIDRYPLEHERHRDNMRFSSTFGHPVIDSTYRDDFIPWSERDQALCRAKLHVPDHMLKTESTDAGRGDASRRLTQAEYDYYCPPHCCGDQNPEKSENCLVGHERLFNLGPPVRRTCPMPEKSPHPFAKYSNYMLDYKGSKIPPKRRVVRASVDIDEPQYPMSSKTTYKDAFSRTPKMGMMPRKKEGQVDNLTVGDGPMIQESTSTVDFRDPDVRTHKPERPPRPVYQPPACSMETTTTTGSTYKRWEDLPVQVKPQVYSKPEDTSFQQHETDVRRLITTYQEDFDGINSALCPCRVVEKYGPRVLEPRYSYRKSNSLHDMFCSEIRAKICPH